jgi:hypothetical protein
MRRGEMFGMKSPISKITRVDSSMICPKRRDATGTIAERLASLCSKTAGGLYARKGLRNRVELNSH